MGVVAAAFLAVLVGLGFPSSAHSARVDVSVFGTIEHARSDSPYRYRRFVDDQGTWNRGSVFGLQLDAELQPGWRATVQSRLAPSIQSDDRWEHTFPWAFLSWRPEDDWRVRVGKVRAPGYLHAENMDVGSTFAYAQLPIEMYSLSPSMDITGVLLNKEWAWGVGDIGLDAYWGKSNIHWRMFFREGLPGVLEPGTKFMPLSLDLRGALLAYRMRDDVYQIGLHHIHSENDEGNFWPRPMLVEPIPGVQFYDVFPSAERHGYKRLALWILNAGVDVGLGDRYRMSAEVAVRRSDRKFEGLNATGGYVAVRRDWGAWTPYVSVAHLRSQRGVLQTYHAMDQTTVPSAVPGADLIRASQIIGADSLQPFDQGSWAIGTSYSMTTNQKLKIEWVRTRIGSVPSMVDMVDIPSGVAGWDRSIHSVGVSYSFVF
ncbi:hypothetical protein Cenrod_0378 [Candidatus Symbiobacter mobilis CR]|uniref:Uncharacterized protein n=2 Tax=Candidatus Symbiobacter TaxID=1436289 RepID=U5N4S9_9BURK|nr:hypothetical protein Cenrod_0378 [Candidatus Symbiobacter mobilis CR]